jgi:Tol biopolymer transport system component/DNA-binding winged helix-turn-helix (wHTH) protein
VGNYTKPTNKFGDVGRIRFGPFVADLESQELFKNQTRLRIRGQSYRVLVELLTRPGLVVTREELRRSLWPSDTFVDFEHDLSAAVNRLRDVLGDSAERPRYIETLPRRGYRFIGTLEHEKQSFSGSDASFIPRPSAPVRLDAVVPPERHSRSLQSPHLIGMLATLTVATSLVLFVVRNLHRAETSPTSVPRPFTSLPGLAEAPSFSPDGSRIAFAWNGGKGNLTGFDLYVKALGGEEKLQLTRHPSDWICSAWSPDGTQIAFHRLAGKDTGIYLVPAMGGPERKLIATRTPYNVAAPISWYPDGKWITFSSPLPNEPSDRLFRVSTETSQVVPLEHDPECVHEGTAMFSHDGEKIFYVCVHTMYEGDLRSRDIVGGVPKVIVSMVSPPVGLTLSGDDERVGFSNGYGWSFISFANVKDGSIKRVAAPDNSSWPTVSAHSDKLAFSTQHGNSNIWRRDLLDPGAPPVNVVPSSREQNSPRYSPDGKRIAFESKRDGDWALWVSDVDGGNLLKLSKEVAGSGGPRWSPDGTKVAFDTAGLNLSSIYVVDVAEASPRKLRTQIPDMKLPAWSHDGRSIYFTSDYQGGHRTYRCAAEGGIAEQIPTDVHATRSQESPDGQYLYVTSREVNSQLERLPLNDPKGGMQAMPTSTFLHWTLWQITASGIYFVPQEAPRTMRYFEFATQRVKDLFTLDKDFDDGISISTDGHYILYSQVDEVNADIMVMDKWH